MVRSEDGKMKRSVMGRKERSEVRNYKGRTPRKKGGLRKREVPGMRNVPLCIMTVISRKGGQRFKKGGKKPKKIGGGLKKENRDCTGIRVMARGKISIEIFQGSRRHRTRVQGMGKCTNG